ncbi:MAG: single-stranded-DNA-specific exonuclease RecJ [Gammaproteobacteria bacterium]|nr:single-stranded-DNA-specific exonuclease RecJ [Gammaproteobacteria bacterium]
MNQQIKNYPSASISTELSALHPLLQQIYSARGITSNEQLTKKLSSLLPYHQLQGITNATQLLWKSLQQQQHIMLIGDFDADGATSVTLAVLALRAFSAKKVSYLVPNRFTYGYGLTPEIVAVAAKQQPDLIITVDNGIASVEGVVAAKGYGIKVLITDHHLPGKILPDADSIVNPNQHGDQFPSKNLAGVGVIFYVMLALRSLLREKNWFAERQLAEPNMAQFLDLVALGTVADVVPLDQNNRILVHQGLQRIRIGQCRPGIQALINIAKRQQHNLQASDLGFAVGPRLNAAGRLDDMSLGIECLLTDNLQKAKSLAQQLNTLNIERRDIETNMCQQALAIINKLHLASDNMPMGLCLFDESWHQGVIGILASRIKEKYYRPVIAFAVANDQELKGSARSIKGLHIRDILDKLATRHPHLLSKFGGHAMAAGLSLPKKNYQQFRQVFADIVSEELHADQLQNILYSDGQLTIDNFKLPFSELLSESGPWGQSFPTPLFDGVFDIIEQRLVGQQHLKLLLRYQETIIDAIAFYIDVEQWPNHHCQKIHIAYHLDINEFNNRRSIQLNIQYLQGITH